MLLIFAQIFFTINHEVAIIENKVMQSLEGDTPD